MSIFDRITETPGDWLLAEGNHSDIVLSSRIRLARNFTEILFPEFMDNAAADDLKSKMREFAKNCRSLNSPEILEMIGLSQLERMILIERHLISKELANKTSGMLITEQSEKLNIMVNEEDHLRIQSIDSGLQLNAIWEKISELDDEIDSKFNYAFSPEYGYLTACPTNVGTGMRCSVLVHLPGIVLIKQLQKIQTAIEKVGLTIRGYDGEGTESIGNFFQISNQITLGKSEADIIAKIDNIVHKIIEHEESSRKILYQESKARLEDQIFRAYGILKNARIISSNETMTLLSFLRLGVNMKIIPDIPVSKLNEILVLLQPGHLQKIAGSEIHQERRDAIRAQMIREKFLI